ncbi:ArsR/SmtB family transcription factor [Kribbella shirazensis]|jgi:ArsR family transcriptional regulator, arsenate/arsenite/antimonite-responsive transcriptional repressor|uniref:ArsR family transcriptional regulator n=1 Tax=Kribbella shirazensis TaxID=1105143 RepID=A0A7X5VEM4_9ACTN|nr:metalloregulator ArsR/SmtB family transcription factor [Kribbella shirazensis]NIK59816.1 ArsR family transcriptional regulator [Kribbella shirazensis]
MSKQEIVLGTGSGCCTPISEAALDPVAAADGAAVFKALADPIRLRLMSIIASAGGELCVCDITPQFEVSGPTISHHLRVLREAGLVDCERRGTWVYYWPIPERLRWIASLLAAPEPVAAS